MKLKSELLEIENEIENLNHKYYVKDKISEEIFEKYSSELMGKKTQILKEIKETEKNLSNHTFSFQKALNFCSEIPKLWESSNYATKEKLQRLIFPDGVLYDKG